MAKVIDLVGTITYKPYSNSYVFLINTIIGQMLSNKVADIISARLKVLCNGHVTPSKINNLTIKRIKSIGISLKKTRYIKELTKLVINNQISFSNLKHKTDDEIISEITKIHGLGTWSAKMYLIFCLNRQNIVPYEDKAFIQSFKLCYKTNDASKDSIMKKAKQWYPYSSIAARYLYKALDSGYLK